MIWIKNHGIRGESDNLRIPLSQEIDEMACYQNDPESCPAIVVMRGWTGIDINADVDDTRNGFKSALGPQLRFAVDEPADNDDYNDKSEELGGYYEGSHPDIND